MRIRGALAELGTFAALAGLLGVLAVGFAWPWQSGAEAGGGLHRYYPAPDGHTYLSREENADGAVSWTSGNVRRVPALRALNEWRDAPRNALREMLARGDDLTEEELIGRFRGVSAVEIRERRLEEGAISDGVSYAVRDSAGEWLVALYDVEQRRDTVFDPPVLNIPADLHAASTWSSKGAVGSGRYTYSARVTGAGPHTTDLGAFDDCLIVESTLTLTPPEGEDIVERTTEHACAEIGGGAESATTDAQGTLLRSVTTVAVNDRVAALAPPAPAAATSDTALEIREDWELTRLGRTARTGEATESTIPPVYVDGDDPLVLGAAYGGDLVAFAADVAGEVRWRFHAGGTVYGTPTPDPATGRIFFGATDKRLYAVDRNGFFLWSHRTGDSVATRPLVLGELVIFGSEDRRVTALQAATGELRWSYGAKDAVVSAPAVAAGVVAVGSDSGGVVGLDPRDGAVRWEHAMAAPVEGAVTAVGDAFAVVATDGTVTVLDAATGRERWSYAEIGSVRAPAAAGDDVLFVVDGVDGRVHAIDLADGTRRWRTAAEAFVGPVIATGDAVVAAAQNGTVSMLAADSGDVLASWEAATATGAQDQPPQFAIGPTAGGGAVWIADQDSVVRRLGAVREGTGAPADLHPTWFQPFTESPYDGIFQSPAAADGGSAVVLDGGGVVYRVDPATGEGTKLGALDLPNGSVPGPVVANGRVLVAAQGTLHSANLSDLDDSWTYEGDGNTVQRPVVAGDTVLYATTPPTQDNSTSTVTVHALAATTGDVRWTVSVDGVAAGTGVAVDGSTVFTAGIAFDLATGQELWRYDTGTFAPVSGVTSQDGVHYVAGLDPESDKANLTALDELGAPLWSVEIPDAVQVYTAPEIAGDTIVVTGLAGSIRALDRATGAQRWEWQPPADLFGGATVHEDSVWVATTDAHITVLDLATGEVTATFTDLDLEIGPFAYAQRPTPVGRLMIVPLGAVLLGFDVAAVQ